VHWTKTDLTHYNVGVIPPDACRNHDHKLEKIPLYTPIFIIVKKSVLTVELAKLYFSVLIRGDHCVGD
jgi:hypothetical protein